MNEFRRLNDSLRLKFGDLKIQIGDLALGIHQGGARLVQRQAGRDLLIERSS